MRKAWIETNIPQKANLTVIRDPQLHPPNPYYVEEEGEFIDEKLQESEFINEEFKHEDAILHMDSWIRIIQQPIMTISAMKIIRKDPCHLT